MKEFRWGKGDMGDNKAIVRLVSISLSLSLVFAGFAVFSFARANDYKQATENMYMLALSELTGELSRMSSSLEKSVYAGTPTMAALLSAEVWRDSARAAGSLGMLPLSGVDLSDAQRLIAQSGAYGYSLLKRAAAGESLAEEDRENLKSLAEALKVVSARLFEVKARLDRGEMSLDELKDSLMSMSEEDSRPVSAMSAGASEVTEEETELPFGDFPEYATLIYDGPYSSHIEKREPELLKGQAEISESEARAKAAEYLKVNEETLVPTGGGEGKIPTYSFLLQEEGRRTEVEICRTGGFLLNLISDGPASQPQLSVEQALGEAAQFLENAGFFSMKESYYTIWQDYMTVHYAYEQDGVICYPDLIKVTVALFDGHIAGFEGYGYVMNHRQRDLPDPEVDKDQAEKAVAPGLRILSHGWALIPTDGENEVYCHEIKVENEEGEHLIVYVNAKTGLEENLFLLLEDENGTLTF